MTPQAPDRTPDRTQGDAKRPLRRALGLVAGVTAVALGLVVLPGVARPSPKPEEPAVTAILDDLRTQAALDPTEEDRASSLADPVEPAEPAEPTRPAEPAEAAPPRPDKALVEDLLAELRADAERGGTAGGADPAVGDNPVAGAPAAFVSAQRGARADLGILNIPAIGLKVPYASGVHEVVLQAGPGHWPGTALPGREGNSVISGHRTTFTKPFNKLDQLRPGDHIGTTVGDQPEIVYRVTDTAIVAQATYVDFILDPPEEAGVKQLTLFACHPKGSLTHRIVVRAVVEQPETAAASTSPETGRS